jgi:precorrin-2/cobalt-factor-2 C20-methyltransferase
MDANCFSMALPGHFYAVGVGPGSPDLLTLRAARLIETADVIVAPRSRNATKSLALETVRDHLTNQRVVDHVYAMRRDTAQTLGSWRTVAEEVVRTCRDGQSVVQITIGDPLVYSTSCYLAPLVLEQMAPSHVHLVPGISAFQASACKFPEALTIQEDRLLIMPATDLAAVEAALDHCETLVLYKAGRKIPEVVALLERRGLAHQGRVICYAEQPGREFVTDDLCQAAQGHHGYMATVIVHVNRRTWREN